MVNKGQRTVWWSLLYRRLFVQFHDTDPCGRAVHGVGLRALDFWDRGFEYP